MLTTTPAPEYEDDIDLLRYGRFLASYWILLVAFSATGAAAGLIIASRAPLLYQATATLNVAPNADSTLGLTPATSRALLADLSLVGETLAELQLGVTPQAFVDEALTVQPVPSTNLVRLSIVLPDADQAQTAADRLAQKAVALNRRLETDGARTVQQALSAQLAEAARRLEDAQARLFAYQARAQVDLRAARALGHLTRDLDEGRVGMELQLGMLTYELSESSGGGRGDGRQRSNVTDSASGKEFADLYRAVLELKRHEADYEASRKVYLETAVRHGEASGRAVEHRPQLQIVGAAVRPDRPMPRRPAQHALLGGLLGLVAGAVAAVLVNRRRMLAAGR